MFIGMEGTKLQYGEDCKPDYEKMLSLANNKLLVVDNLLSSIHKFGSQDIYMNDIEIIVKLVGNLTVVKWNLEDTVASLQLKIEK